MRKTLLAYIRELKRGIFKTQEIAAISGKSLSSVTQGLTYLQKQGLVFKVYRGLWAEISNIPLSPYSVIPYLPIRGQSYLSFISALHLYGFVEQIPQIITLASTGHTHKITTSVGTFAVYQIQPSFFKGFEWYRGTGDFLIGEQEKVLIDCLYVSAYKRRISATFLSCIFQSLSVEERQKDG